MSVAIESVKFWINAFIPRNIPNYTRTVPKGADKGKTMIPGPVRPFGIQVADCYLTDQRSFDSHIHAKSRCHSEFRIDFSSMEPRLVQYHNCDETTEVDCEDGDCECKKKGDTSRMKFSLLKSPAPGKVLVQMQCAANNPCSPSSALFGDIDYSGRILIDLRARAIEFDGLIDAFPAFEAYATMNDGRGIAIFEEPPPPGNTVMNLPADANRPIRARLEDRDGDGVFDEVCGP